MWLKLLFCIAREAKGCCGILRSKLALDWRERVRPNATWGQRYHPEFGIALEYLEQSRIAREQRIAADEKRRKEQIERDKRELEETKLFVAQQAGAARRMRWLIVALLAIFLLALATAGYLGMKVFRFL